MWVGINPPWILGRTRITPTAFHALVYQGRFPLFAPVALFITVFLSELPRGVQAHLEGDAYFPHCGEAAMPEQRAVVGEFSRRGLSSLFI